MNKDNEITGNTIDIVKRFDKIEHGQESHPSLTNILIKYYVIHRILCTFNNASNKLNLRFWNKLQQK